MMKNIKDDYNVNSNLRYELQRATIIASDLRLSEINTAVLVLSMLKDNYSKISEIYVENGINVFPDTCMDELYTSKEFYEKVFQTDFPFENKSEKNNEKIDNSQNKNDIKNVDEISKEIINTIEIEFINQSQEYYYDLPYSRNLKQAILDAGNRCRVCGKDYIDEENLLYSILSLPECSAKRLLQSIHDDISADLNIEIDLVDLNDDLVNNYNICFSSFENKIVIPRPLESFCTILNEKYKKGMKCDILGRDNELNELWSILSKKQKSNAILAGEAGVGKSAIVEALTMSIVNGTCPKKFIGFQVVEVDISGMVAGTKYRGEFEKKVEYLIDFINHYDNLIIFVDEMHHIMGAGSCEGAGPDLSGALKPILARDKIKFIGATTLNEYKKYICSDNAFKRRFELVIINEPKQNQVLPMLKVKIDNLKKFHNVTISKKILEYVQLCAACFNTSTCNPDKTLDLIDRAMVSATLVNSKSVNISHVDKVFYKNYEKYEKNLPEINKRTAYHESGHFVVNILYKEMLVDMELYAVSIIPGFDFLGANVYEYTDKEPKCDLSFYKARIASLLAGRIAEEMFFNEITSGATNDLGKATYIARNMVSSYGLSFKGYGNFSIYDDKTGNTLSFSEKVINDINKEAKEIVDDVYQSTKELLNKEENMAKIDTVAKILLKKNIVSAKELEEAINKL